MGSIRRPTGQPPVEPSSTAEQRLTAIAELLDTHVEVFTDGAQAPPDLRGGRELLEIWSELDSPDEREQLLAFARGLLRRR